MRFRFRSLLLMMTALCLALGVLSTYRMYFRVTARGTSSAAANRVMWHGYKLPPSACDVTFHADFGGCEAEFSILEGEFLDWCKERGWSVAKIESPVPYFQSILLPSDERPVARGYRFSPPDGEGVFDADRARAAFYVSAFP